MICILFLYDVATFARRRQETESDLERSVRREKGEQERSEKEDKRRGMHSGKVRRRDKKYNGACRLEMKGEQGSEKEGE